MKFAFLICIIDRPKTSLFVVAILLLLACDNSEELIPPIPPGCDVGTVVTFTFENLTSAQQAFDIDYFYCNESNMAAVEVPANETISLQYRVEKNEGVIHGPPLSSCDLTVLWKDEPIASQYQVIYPLNSCRSGDRYRTEIENEFIFQIIDKEPCIERNKNFSLTMTNTMDTSIHLFLEHNSVRFYSPTASQDYNPKCHPNMCCQFPTEVQPGESYNFENQVLFFTLHSIGFEMQDHNFNNLIKLFNPEEGIIDSVVTVEIRGVVLDSLLVTYSN